MNLLGNMLSMVMLMYVAAFPLSQVVPLVMVVERLPRMLLLLHLLS